MTRYRVIAAAAAALVLTAPSAHAQRWGGGSRMGREGSSEPRQQAAHALSAASSNGTPSKWGGSPVDSRGDARFRERGERGMNAYIPVAVDAPAPVAVISSVNPGCPQADGSVEMPVITTQHEQRQLTTIEVYRLQPRFQRYQQP
jgi:hypothetical protein